MAKETIKKPLAKIGDIVIYKYYSSYYESDVIQQMDVLEATFICDPEEDGLEGQKPYWKYYIGEGEDILYDHDIIANLTTNEWYNG